MSRMRSNAVVGEAPKIVNGMVIPKKPLPPLPGQPPIAPPLPPPGKFPTPTPRPLAVAFDAALAKAVADRDALHPVYEVSFPTSQRLVYPASFGASAGPMDFAWQTKFALQERAGLLRVTVKISATQPGPGTPPTKIQVGDEVKRMWQTHIASSWSGATLRVPAPPVTPPLVPDRDKLLQIVFNIEWVTGPAGASGYDVDTQASRFPTLPPVPPKRAAGPGATQAEKEAAERADRNRLERWGAAAKADLNTQLNSDATVHMGLWGRGDRGAVIHEFGHMLGLPDEYYTVRWNGQAVPASYAAEGNTKPSLMNNPYGNGGGCIEVRHFDTVRRAYEKWKGLAKDSTQILLNGRPATHASPAGLG